MIMWAWGFFLCVCVFEEQGAGGFALCVSAVVPLPTRRHSHTEKQKIASALDFYTGPQSGGMQLSGGRKKEDILREGGKKTGGGGGGELVIADFHPCSNIEFRS